jgi:soluble lytic murein transglycosylase-like protein
MKKIYLSFVLSIVSVFSILAQTSAQNSAEPTVEENVVEKVKIETNATVSAIAQTTGKTNEALFSNDKEKPSPTEKPNKTIKEEKKSSDEEAAQKPAAQLEKKLESTVSAKTPAAIAPAKDFDLKEAKPRMTETEKTLGLSALLRAQNASLGALTTGNTAVDGYIEEFSLLYNIDPLLIYAQMSQESSFKRTAVSPKGASGFMQLMPDTARRFGVTNIYNPKQNIKAGVKYMRWLLDKFGGDPRLALAGYNAGEGAVMKHGNKIPPYRETQNYVTKIMNHYETLSNQDSNVALID